MNTDITTLNPMVVRTALFYGWWQI